MFLFLQNINLNFPLCVWHILCKFVQKADIFIILFHHTSELLLLWTSLYTLSSWITLHPQLLRATNTKYVAMYVDLPPGINLNLHSILLSAMLSLRNIVCINVCFGGTHCLPLPGECECEGIKHFWIVCTRIHGFISRSTPLYTSELVTSSHSSRWLRREAESLTEIGDNV